MLRAKIELEEYLKVELRKILSKTKIISDVCEYAYQTYGIPKDITSDFISRKPLSEATEFVLFCLLDAIEHVNGQSYSKITHYFVDKEIDAWKNTKYKIDKVRFPLRFKVVQVSEDQWIGRITLKTLMKLRAAQLINYDENTQRTMQKVIRGDNEVYQITIDEATVSAIADLYREDKYIPTPFTLNLPAENLDNDFYYDEDSCELVIKSLDMFNIVDGYHRYIAACRVCDENDDFDYSMELRIINFFVTKAQQFIYQQDQKTKMKKSDSDSYNSTRYSNMVVTRLNNDMNCEIVGQISNNKGIINFGQMSNLVELFYFKYKNKEEQKKLLTEVYNELKECFNLLASYDQSYKIEKYTYKKLVTIMTCFNYYTNRDKSKMCEVIRIVMEKVGNIENSTFLSNNKVLRRYIKDVENIIKEVS